jgi:hypothetical protein
MPPNPQNVEMLRTDVFKELTTDEQNNANIRVDPC